MTRTRLFLTGILLAATALWSPWWTLSVILAAVALVVLVCAITEPPEPSESAVTAVDVYARARLEYPSAWPLESDGVEGRAS